MNDTVLYRLSESKLLCRDRQSLCGAHRASLGLCMLYESLLWKSDMNLSHFQSVWRTLISLCNRRDVDTEKLREGLLTVKERTLCSFHLHYKPSVVTIKTQLFTDYWNETVLQTHSIPSQLYHHFCLSSTKQLFDQQGDKNSSNKSSGYIQALWKNSRRKHDWAGWRMKRVERFESKMKLRTIIKLFSSVKIPNQEKHIYNHIISKIITTIIKLSESMCSNLWNFTEGVKSNLEILLQTACVQQHDHRNTFSCWSGEKILPLLERSSFSSSSPSWRKKQKTGSVSEFTFKDETSDLISASPPPAAAVLWRFSISSAPHLYKGSTHHLFVLLSIKTENRNK